MDALGGVARAGFLHRVFAVVNILYFVLEGGYMIWYVVATQGPMSSMRIPSSRARRTGRT